MPAKIITHPPKNWRFRVTKLGALTHGGEFEIKPLTLFCGENNSGKTWAMYATYNFLQMRKFDLYLTHTLRRRDFSDEIAAKNPHSDRKWIKAMISKACVRAIARTNEAMSKNLSEFFNADEGLLAGAKFEWLANEKFLVDNITQSEWEGEFKTHYGLVIANKAKGTEHIKFVSADGKDVDYRRFPPYLIDRYYPSMLNDTVGCRRAFLMPAERSGLHLFYRELSSRRTALLHHASKVKIDLDELLYDVRRSPYADPIAHYINWLNDVSNKKTKSPFADIAQLLATKLAGGKYRVDKEGNIFFTPRKIKDANAGTMGLHTTSSTVKSMFGLWYYLQHEAQLGHVLMIDEPELNLHPANQRILARLLAQLANRGLCVVASTHSDYIVREINTLIMLNEKDRKKAPKRASLMKKHKISEGEVINPNMVGAYVMSAQSGRVEPMKIDKNDGINAKTLDDVIGAQGKENDEVYYSLAK